MMLFPWRRRLVVNITCPHGAFIPATYRVGDARRLGCAKCDFHVRLTWVSGGDR